MRRNEGGVAEPTGLRFDREAFLRRVGVFLVSLEHPVGRPALLVLRLWRMPSAGFTGVDP